MYPPENKFTEMWSREDDARIVELFARYGSWKQVQLEMLDRSINAMKTRRSILKKLSSMPRRWEEPEDIRLATLMGRYDDDWDIMRHLLHNRTLPAVEARGRALRMGVARNSRTAWTKTEDQLMIELPDKYGNNHAILMNAFQDRGFDAARTHLHLNRTDHAKQAKGTTLSSWSAAEDRRLKARMNRLGRENWLGVAGSIPNQTAEDCRRRSGQLGNPQRRR